MTKTIYELFPNCDVDGLDNLAICDERDGREGQHQRYRICNGKQINHLWTINQKTKNTVHIDINENPMVFIPQNLSSVDLPKNLDNVKTLVDNKQALSVSGKELYRIYYNMDEETYTRFAYGYSSRTKSYIDATKQRIGLESYTSVANCMGGADSVPTKGLEHIYYLPAYFNSSEIEVGQSGEHWIAQFTHWYDIDDYAVTKFIFNRKPNIDMIYIAQTILEVESYFKCLVDRDKGEFFVCWECGCKTHWLDGPGDIQQKFDNLKEKYCGC